MGCFAPGMMERLLPFDPGCLRCRALRRAPSLPKPWRRRDRPDRNPTGLESDDQFVSLLFASSSRIADAEHSPASSRRTLTYARFIWETIQRIVYSKRKIFR